MANEEKSVREVHVFGPLEGDPGRTDFQPAVVTWSRTDDGRINLALCGPFGEHVAVESDVFTALLFLRAELENSRWQLLVNAARCDAWGPTEQHPCDVDQVRLFPDLAGPPAPEPVDALDVFTDVGDRGTLVTEQMLWREEWAGLVKPGKMNWTEYDRSMRKIRAELKREAAEAAAQVPELTNTEPVLVLGKSPEDPQRRQVQEAVAEWGRRAGGGVHLRLRGPFGQFDEQGPDLFTPLQQVRRAMLQEGWAVLVNAALFGAWGGTPQHPCGIAHVRIYPSLTGPPLPEQLDVLGTPPGRLQDAHWSPVGEQTAWHHEWAGTTPPGRLTWTEFKRKLREEKNQEKSSGVGGTGSGS
ncbi:hypothetical protein OOZ19_25580 [Saccharopolyspora sp. NFXS83]|uniref:hypothetical protein n=1 Tax=Saccharopolyspora sp. NFXS83 TaxID=2993560 RepID=UPI00224AA19A|nr:hypothetical protein [Saccharopolyspora sp. NFXS83]MCX2733628.1 hypothetical protein [Saccharopolyspora sp. NFXS83]